MRRTHDFTKLSKLLVKAVVVPLQRNILDVAVGPVVLTRALVASDEFTYLDFLPVNQHTIKFIDRGSGSFGSLVVDISVSLRLACLSISDDLARKNVPEKTECIVKLLVVDRLVEVLHENVTNS